MSNVVKIAQELIRKKSVTPVDDGAIDFLKNYLEKLGFKCTVLDFEGSGSYPVKNFYARYGEAQPNFCFAGHTDVVPVGNEKDWSVDPFAGEIRDDMLIGRGAVDMKGGVAAFVAAAEQFVKSEKFSGSVSFLITGDEEAKAINGTKKVLKWLEENGEKLDACLVGEPTNPSELGEMIKIGRRGSITFDLEVEGVQGHVAYPHQADNPIRKLVNVLYDLNNLVLDKGNDHFQPSNLEVVNIDVGNAATNVIPARAKATFNIRFNDVHIAKEIEKIIHDVVAKSAGSKFKLIADIGAEAFITKAGKLSEALNAVIEEKFGKKAELSTTGGTSDARFIKDYCPVVEFGLINKTAHQVDEQISIVDLENLTEIYYKLLYKYFK